MKKGWKIVLCILLALVLVVGGYVAYVLIDYHRIGDQELAVQNGAAETSIAAGETYKIVSYNIGFGAYESDYGFFMDGGTESRAWSEERLTANLDRIARTLTDQNAEFYLVQEVDIDSTRSYHVDEREPLYAALSWENSVFCQNYDSPYLMYPLTKPHGASRSGLLTFAPAEITSARRVELPVESGFMKLLDLDRCYSRTSTCRPTRPTGRSRPNSSRSCCATCSASTRRETGASRAATSTRICSATRRSISVRRIRRTPGRSPSPMRPSMALPCVWLRRSTNRILCRAAATPTARIMRDSMF